MSRTPGFSAESTPRRRPSRVHDNGVPGAVPAVRPLQIHPRPPSRPTTPSRDSPVSASLRRPMRSGLRDRQVSEYSATDRASLESRATRESRDPYDAVESLPIRSDYHPAPRSRNNGSSMLTSNPLNGQYRYGAPAASPISPVSDPSELSPTSRAAVAAFQSFGRRRGMSEAEQDDDYAAQRRQEIEDQKARQRKLRAKTPGLKTTGKARAGDIDAVLDEIKDEWGILIDQDFNPVDLALQLFDDSSVGKDMNSFLRTKDMLSKALKGSVDKHYEAFAGALPHHTALVNHLDVTQTQITEARSALQEAKDTLGKKRADLVQLWSRSQTVEEMLRILDQIEHLRSVPDILESLISEKRLLQAAVLLVRSLKLINKQDMLEIGAVSDLRSYLNGQEVALREILIEELHSHLYLKSFWCESRWAVYTPGQQTLAKVEFEEEGFVSEAKPPQSTTSSPTSPTSSRSSRLRRFLGDLALRANDFPYDVDEQTFRNSTSGMGLSTSGSTSALGLSTVPSLTAIPNTALPTSTAATFPASMTQPPPRNPEADSFGYIENLLESLAVLGKLGNSLDVVAQKLPGEIYALVDTTIAEVEDRAEYGRRGSMLATTSGSSRLDNMLLLAAPGTSMGSMGLGSGIAGVSAAPLMANPLSKGRNIGLNAISLRLTALESSTKLGDQETLKDFLWTLYSKLDAVAQGLRVVYEVANRIGSRRDFKDSSGAKPGSLFPLAEVWMPVQAEVRTLLTDYVTDEEQSAVSGRNPISSINEVLREGKFSRDRSKPVFRFADTDPKFATNVLRVHEDDLTRVLKDTVPGLVQGLSENAVQATLSAVGTDDRLLGTGQHHRMLVHPDAFHVTLLFQPTLAFLDRIADILPSGLEAARSSSVLLDDFVLKVYLPQLEDKVSFLFHQTVTDLAAFEPDVASTRFSPQPLIKASVQLLALINSLCAMLRTTPFHRENYSRLILTVIGQFYQRCSDRFSDLVAIRDDLSSSSGLCVAMAAQWAQRAELGPCLSELYKYVQALQDSPELYHLCRQETHLEQSILGEQSVGSADLISSVRNLSALASLYRSVTWFTAELNTMKSAPEHALSPTTPSNVNPMSAVTPYTPYLPAIAPLQPNEPLSLPLSSAMALRFQALIMTYAQLAELILYSIRIDIRCRAIHHLELALRCGIYRAEREVGEPDPYIIDLNVELSKCDDCISSTLPEKERRFVFEGLGQLLEHLLIANARYIRSANVFGIKKMMRNILALQQNIKTITENSHDAEFERAKRYYSLFMLSPQDMLDGIREKQDFSFDEYKTMLDLQCGVDPTASDGAAQATDRNYNMYVIDREEEVPHHDFVPIYLLRFQLDWSRNITTSSASGSVWA